MQRVLPEDVSFLDDIWILTDGEILNFLSDLKKFVNNKKTAG